MRLLRVGMAYVKVNLRKSQFYEEQFCIQAPKRQLDLTPNDSLQWIVSTLQLTP